MKDFQEFLFFHEENRLVIIYDLVIEGQENFFVDDEDGVEIMNETDELQFVRIINFISLN